MQFEFAGERYRLKFKHEAAPEDEEAARFPHVDDWWWRHWDYAVQPDGSVDRRRLRFASHRTTVWLQRLDRETGKWDLVNEATAYCSARDHFCKEIGRQTALLRAARTVIRNATFFAVVWDTYMHRKRWEAATPASV